MKTDMFERLHKFNKTVTVSITIPWMLIGTALKYGNNLPDFIEDILGALYLPIVLLAILLPVLGAYQYCVSMLILFKNKIPKNILLFHVVYLILGLFIIITQVMLLCEYHPIFPEDAGYLFTISGGVILAYFHLWITYRLKNEEVRNV